MLKRVRFFVSLIIFGLVAFCDWVKSVVKFKMGTIIDEEEKSERKDLEDSGCVEDGSMADGTMADGRVIGAVNLLDLSDDVLLYILRHCTPRDLKALGFSCPRLGRLVRERSLWRSVDARCEPCGEARLQWYVTHALHADTRQLFVRGYADESSGCLGILNCSRREAEDEQKTHPAHKSEAQGGNGTGVRAANAPRHGGTCLYVSANGIPGLPRFRGSPLWADEAGLCRPGPAACAGPRFTVCEPLLRELRARCFKLARLALEHCNVNCNTTNLGLLPPTLTSLSLRGAKCYNLPVDKSFLFKIQDHLPLLETLDVSECDWLEPSSLLPLSKHARLRELLMCDCQKMAEFVAYASLSSRYGFRNLQVLDLRGSPVGDSEVAPLAWLPKLQELRLAAAARVLPPRHGHYADDALAPRRDLDPWEMQEPDYFKQASEEDTNGDGRMDVDSSSQHSADDADEDDDDDDDDMNGAGSSRIRRPDPREHGECSKSKRDGSTTKRKAENGGGDAGVNGNPSRSKRKKNARAKDDSSSSEESSKDSEEEMYEKRRCQTIVIVDRRYISDNEDGSFVRFARRCIGEENVRARNARLRANRANERREAANRSAEAKEEAQAKPKPEPSENETPREGAPPAAGADDKAEEKTNKDAEGAKSDDKPRHEDPKDKADHKESEKKDSESNEAATSGKSGADVAKSDVNQGASTSRDSAAPQAADGNEQPNNERGRNEEGERYVRFRQGEDPVIVNLIGRRMPNQEILQPERVVSFNSYNIRHEVIDNQQIFNVEIERCSMHEGCAQPGVNVEVCPLHEAPAWYEGQNGEQRRNPAAEMPREAPPLAPIVPPQAPVPPQDDHPPQPVEIPQEFMDAFQRQAMARARLRERNPNIMNLIREGEPLGLPPPLAVFPPLPGLDENREPRHRVLYVNVGQPGNALGPLPNFIHGIVSDRDNRILNLSRTHLNPSALVTDAAVRRFGRAAGNDIRFVLVGIPHPVLGPNNDGGARPERSNLRVLVMNGYRNITDRSLIHLATAAPHLRLLDFRETSVTAQGVENFRSLRPDCEVLFSPYVERKVEWPDEDD